MKYKISFCIFITCVSVSCHNSKPFHVEEVKNNPPYVANTAFTSFEDLSSPKFGALKNKYHTDTIFHGEQDEFKRILLLRNWISHTIKISDFEAHYPGEGYADSILDAAIKGQGYHCGHYMVVQNAVMNSYGYITRCMGAGPGIKDVADWHHGVNEIWSNTYKKWFLCDAKYNHHFEKKGIPLSALEIRDEYLKNAAADIVLVKGPNRLPIAYDSLKNAKGIFVKWYKKDFAQAYTWISFEKINNRFTNWPQNSDTLNYINVYDDQYFDNNTWYRDGKPHWAYHTRFWLPVKERKAIEWTPNTVAIKATVENNTAYVRLQSSTPNFKTYQMKTAPGNDWKNITDSITIALNKENIVLDFRAVNLANVAGPESQVSFVK
ncbi:MAG: hypothetical protein QM802_07105 [Agriterribacter sp.]